MQTTTQTSNISDKFTNHFKRAISRAIIIAAQNKRKEVEPQDLFWSVYQERGCLAAEVLLKAGIKIIHKNNEVKAGDIKPSQLTDQDVSVLSENSKKVIQESAMVAATNGHRYIGTEHLLMGVFLKGGDEVDTIMQNQKINKADVSNMVEYLKTILRSTSQFPELTNAMSFLKRELGDLPEEVEETKENKKKNKAPKTPALNLFGLNLTDAKVQERIDPVVGRQQEINRIIQILARRTKNNPVLLGDAGVGKTAIVEGLAKKIVENKVPDILLNKKIYSLDMNQLIAGTMFRGDFENRIQHVLEEVKSNPDIILFIDEIHNIIGAGSGSGTMDAANILKPFLARGEVRCIGATTFDEYKKHIERDPALDRRFQPIYVAEPNQAESIEILKGLRENYEKHHLVKITDDALKAAVKLSARYITEKFLPDKAIDLIDETASRLKVKESKNPDLLKIKELESELNDIQLKKQHMVKEEKYEQALDLKHKQADLRDQIAKIQEKISKTTPSFFGTITNQEIAEVVSSIVKVPLGDLLSQEKNRLINLEQELAQSIAGQNEVLKELAQAVKRSRAGLAGQKRPLGSFIFLGPSGVGKTETAKVVVREVFGTEDNLIRFDMSEFGESFNTTKLIGAPAGYVGYQEGGKLTEQVRRKPYSVVLFDEIEKAHPDIFNLLLQILEDGFLTDAAGKRVNFKNTIIIMTSNIGLESFNQQASLGFAAATGEKKVSQKDLDDKYEQVKKNTVQGLQHMFRPELLNRIDKILVFRPLNKKAISKIIELGLEELKSNLSEQKIDIEWNTSAINLLTNRSFSPDQGARMVRKIIQEHIEGPLADKILASEFKAGSRVKVGVRGKKIVLSK